MNEKYAQWFYINYKGNEFICEYWDLMSMATLKYTRSNGAQLFFCEQVTSFVFVKDFAVFLPVIMRSPFRTFEL